MVYGSPLSAAPQPGADGAKEEQDNGERMGDLTTDSSFLATTFVVIDFETTTPTGHLAQPIEVAALALRYQDGAWKETGRSTSLIRPPAFAPVTPADTAQTGLTAEQLQHAPTPAGHWGRWTGGSRSAPRTCWWLSTRPPRQVSSTTRLSTAQRWPAPTSSTPSRWPSTSSPGL